MRMGNKLFDSIDTVELPVGEAIVSSAARIRRLEYELDAECRRLEWFKAELCAQLERIAKEGRNNA